MKIETKYNIGDRVWVVYEDRGEVSLYDTEIETICIDEENKIYYYGKEGIDIYEDKMINYKDEKGLLNKIQEIMNQIHERERKENNNE